VSTDYIPAALRRLVVERAQARCEYCKISELAGLVAHEIDHIIAEKHGGLTEAENLALSCAPCNKYKGSDIASIDPETKQLTFLYNPRQNKWSDHFQLRDAYFVSSTPTGRVTIRLLQLNHPDRIAERELLIAAGGFVTPGRG
jgi:hypothetical protein